MEDIHTAKRVAQEWTWTMENDLHKEYSRLLSRRNSFNSRQWRFVEGIFECLSGHLFYSATITRYGKCSAQGVGVVRPMQFRGLPAKVDYSLKSWVNLFGTSPGLFGLILMMVLWFFFNYRANFLQGVTYS
jgi:hypothetical protein